VIVDEAGHLTEPETLVALTASTGVKRIVLAGDHHQLAPVVLSVVARHYKLDVSFMERLMSSCNPYRRSRKVRLF